MNIVNQNIKIIIISIIIFSFSFALGFWNLNGTGQVWDEASYLRDGYNLIEMVKHQDFTNALWWKNIDHPPLSKYGRGLVSYLDIEKYTPDGQPVFRYDLTYDRMLSAILVSLTAILVLIIGWRYISRNVGIMAAIIFSMLPILVGHSRIGLLEPFMILTYTTSVFSFILFLENPKRERCVLAGILLGLAMLSKETSIVLLPPFLILMTVIYQKYKKRDLYNKIFIYQLLSIFALGGLTFFIFWPMPFFHIKEMLAFTYGLRFKTHTAIPEVFFGDLQLVRPWYYIIYFLITTPLIVLLLFLYGLYNSNKTKNWFLYILVAWFLFPFVQSFYHNRQQGIRYIIQMYVPMAIIAAYGFEMLISKFVKQQRKKLLFFIPIIIYLFITLAKITPYYIDYFNGLVGGAKGVYEKKLFHLAWWGEGEREAGLWLERNVPNKSLIGLAIGPTHVLPKTSRLSYENYQQGKKYDYVVVSFYEVVRMGFDDSEIQKNYKIIYSVKADGAHLVDIYQREK